MIHKPEFSHRVGNSPTDTYRDFVLTHHPELDPVTSARIYSVIVVLCPNLEVVDKNTGACFSVGLNWQADCGYSPRGSMGPPMPVKYCLPHDDLTTSNHHNVHRSSWRPYYYEYGAVGSDRWLEAEGTPSLKLCETLPPHLTWIW